LTFLTKRIRYRS